MALTFDGSNKLITASSDMVTVDAVTVYSRWIDWVAANSGQYLNFLPAFSVVGGDTISTGITITAYVFLQNGWKIRPLNTTNFEVTGNLLPETGQSAFSFAPGIRPETVRQLALKSETVNVAGGSGATAAEVWTYGTRSLTTSAALTPAQEEQLLLASIGALKTLQK